VSEVREVSEFGGKTVLSGWQRVEWGKCVLYLCNFVDAKARSENSFFLL
jgi:hypothetical protein